MKHKLKLKGNSKLKRGSNCFLLLTKSIFCSIMKLVLDNEYEIKGYVSADC